MNEDGRIRQILDSVLLTPLKAEIAAGKLDECIAYALVRVTLPLILLILVLIVVSIIQIHTTVRLCQQSLMQ